MATVKVSVAMQKQVAARKNQIIVDTKEIQLRPRTDQHDLETKIRHARRFLLDGDKVKVSLRFSGREAADQEQGLKVFDKVGEALADISILETAPKKEGRQVFVLYAPAPVKIKEYKKIHGDDSKAKMAATTTADDSSDAGVGTGATGPGAQ